MIIRKVMVVEDEIDIQKVIRMSLKSRGVADIVVANNGEECLALVNDAKPDLILLDVSMPKMDGYETCRMLKANPQTQSIPVIFLTAKVQKNEEEVGTGVGAAGYISKPFDPMTLHGEIVAILSKVAPQENI